jgi:hypothetical protein
MRYLPPLLRGFLLPLSAGDSDRAVGEQQLRRRRHGGQYGRPIRLLRRQGDRRCMGGTEQRRGQAMRNMVSIHYGLEKEYILQ